VGMMSRSFGAALAQLPCEKQLIIVPGATHLFEEPGALDEVLRVARWWFEQHLFPCGAERIRDQRLVEFVLAVAAERAANASCAGALRSQHVPRHCCQDGGRLRAILMSHQDRNGRLVHETIGHAAKEPFS
jgi:hypothetical protein